MAFLAAVTDRITLATGVLVVPNHQAGGPGQAHRHRRRAVGGPGAHVPGRRMDGRGAACHRRRPPHPGPTDRRDASRRCASCGPTPGPRAPSYSGSSSRFDHAHSFPKPVRPGGVPLHIGGHSEAAARRAGRLGDGFQPLGLSPDDLALRIGQMRDAAERAGRDPDAIELSVSGYLPTTTEEEVAAAAAAGIDRMLLSTSMSQDLGRTGRRGVGLRRAVRPSGAVTRDGRRRTCARSPPAYADAVDALDGAAFAALFTEDGELWVPGPRPGSGPVDRRSGAPALARIPSGLARYHGPTTAVGARPYTVDGTRPPAR